MARQVALRSCRLSLFTMMMALIRRNLKRFIMDHKAYMYVLECRDGSYYTGYTTDVRRRLAVHNSGKGAKYTRARLPVKLIYAQGFASKEEAMSAEALLKRKKRPQKERFLSENQEKIYSVILKSRGSPLTPLTFVKN